MLICTPLGVLIGTYWHPQELIGTTRHLKAPHDQDHPQYALVMIRCSEKHPKSFGFALTMSAENINSYCSCVQLNSCKKMKSTLKLTFIFPTQKLYSSAHILYDNGMEPLLYLHHRPIVGQPHFSPAKLMVTTMVVMIVMVMLVYGVEAKVLLVTTLTKKSF